MPYHVIVKHTYTVAAIEVFGADWTSDCPALEFLEATYKDSNTTSSCKGFRALFGRLAQHGPAGLTSAMMHEANKGNRIMELVKGRLRLLCFIQEDTIFLTNGYLKSSQKADAAEVVNAIRAKDRYLESYLPSTRPT